MGMNYQVSYEFAQNYWIFRITRQSRLRSKKL